MNTEDLKNKLAALSERQLVVAMRTMNGGSVGFDYSKRSKKELRRQAYKMAEGISTSDIAEAWRVVEKALKDTGFAAADQLPSMAARAWGAEHGPDGGSDDAGDDDHDDSPQEDGEYDDSEEDYDEDRPSHGGASAAPRTRMGAPKVAAWTATARTPRTATAARTATVARAANRTATARMRRASQEKRMSNSAIKKRINEEVSRAVKAAKAEMEDKNTFKIEVKAPGEGGEQKVNNIDDKRPRHEVFKEVCNAVNQGLNVLLVGPAGCGKTYMAEEVASVLGLNFRFTGAVSSEYKLLGFVDAQGRVVRTEYREAYEHGGVFLWDELDGSSAQALLSFNAGLANGHQDFPDKVVTAHPDFRAIASANTYGNGADRMYVGRNQLDAASLDRFYVVCMDYDEGLERKLYGTHEWVVYVQAARQAMRDLGGIRHVISMRAIQMGLKMLETDVPRPVIEKAVLWRHLQDDDVRKIKAAMR